MNTPCWSIQSYSQVTAEVQQPTHFSRWADLVITEAYREYNILNKVFNVQVKGFPEIKDMQTMIGNL